jgi:hypothetical protein
MWHYAEWILFPVFHYKRLTIFVVEIVFEVHFSEEF